MERKTKTLPFAIMVHDPSFTAWGWSILNGHGDVLDHGCIKTVPTSKKLRIRKGDDRVRRITEINQILLSKIKEYGVSYMAAELPHGSQNAQAAIMMGATAGIVQTIADTLDIGIEWYSEGDSKKSALGKLTGSKYEMIDRMKELYKTNWYNVGYKDEAVADSLAIHHVAKQQSSVLKLFK